MLFREKLEKLPHVEPLRQLVVPHNYRKEVMKLAHENAFSGHRVGRKTLKKITNHLHWPGISKEERAFCLSCDICQKIGYPQDTTKATMERVPIMSVPFSTLHRTIPHE